MIFNESDCIGCGQCLEHCKGGAFESEGSYSVKFNPEKCLDCDPCQIICCGESIKKEAADE